MRLRKPAIGQPDGNTRCISGVPTGIRTPVATVKGLCPRPLDDGDVVGGARRDRTVDLLHAMQALSQLSYGPTRGANCPRRSELSQTLPSFT
jgi:hypothetical protein